MVGSYYSLKMSSPYNVSLLALNKQMPTLCKLVSLQVSRFKTWQIVFFFKMTGNISSSGLLVKQYPLQVAKNPSQVVCKLKKSFVREGVKKPIESVKSVKLGL